MPRYFTVVSTNLSLKKDYLVLYAKTLALFLIFFLFVKKMVSADMKTEFT